MKILVFGGSGMLGHKLWQVLGQQHETWVSLRTTSSILDKLAGNYMQIKTGIDANDMDGIKQALKESQTTQKVEGQRLDNLGDMRQVANNNNVNDPLNVPNGTTLTA